jgi:hypothetical protein
MFGIKIFAYIKGQTDRMKEKGMNVKWKMKSRHRRKLEIKKEYRVTMGVKFEAGTKKRETNKMCQKLKKRKTERKKNKNVKNKNKLKPIQRNKKEDTGAQLK